MPRRILSKTKSKIQKAERRGKSKNKVFNIWLGRGGYPFSYTVTVNH